MLDVQIEGFQKLEAHCHSYPISGCSDLQIGRLSAIYKSLGFSTIILTNHYRNGLNGHDRQETIDSYLGAFDKEREIGRELGINVLLGAEITVQIYEANREGVVKQRSNDYLMYGVTRDIFYKYYPFSQFSQLGLYEICQSHNILLIQAHPYRDNKHPGYYDYMDGIEVFNSHYYSQSASVESYKNALDHNKIMTAGTDCHDEESAADAYMMVPNEIETIQDFRDYLKTCRKPIMCNRTLGIIDPSNPPERAEHVR